ncbi:KaiC/GvpD/RAD55 family RecA-like ATPase [Paraburkholderia sp. 40]
MSTTTAAPTPARISSGIEGIDDILGGGLTPNRMYLVEGVPGTGKTTLALQFLLKGLHEGQTGLYIALSETRAELLAIGASHGWDLSRFTIPVPLFRAPRRSADGNNRRQEPRERS